MEKQTDNKLSILVTYYSLSYNTEKLADTLYEHLTTQHNTTITEIEKQNPSKLDEYDLVIIGSPCHSSDLAIPVKNFLKELKSNPSFKLAGFYCHSTYSRKDPHPKAETMFDEWAAQGLNTFKEISIKKNIDLLGIFNCMGAPSPEIKQFIHKEIIQDESEWTFYIQEAMLHPSQEDMDELVEFVDRVIKEGFSV